MPIRRMNIGQEHWPAMARLPGWRVTGYQRRIEMSDDRRSVKDPERQAENPAPMPEGSKPQKAPVIKGPEKPTDIAGQQGGTHGGGRG